MGKRPEDLPLSDLPLHTKGAPDDRDTVWYQTVTEIEAMRVSDEYRFAEDTLRGIMESIERFRTVTPGQRRAIDNIAASKSRADGVRGRRYEGFRGRR
jgi:hypothetical protein